MQLSGFATGGVFARRNIVRISSIAARASLSEPPPAAKPPPVMGKFADSPATKGVAESQKWRRKILNHFLNMFKFSAKLASANTCSAVGRETISKSRVSYRKTRGVGGNFFVKAFLLCVVALFASNVFAQRGYEKSVELGGLIGLDKHTKGGFEITMINGYRCNNNLFLGAGVGFRYTDALSYTTNIQDYYEGKYLIPLYASVKANYTNTKISPFLLSNVGYAFNVGNSQNKNPYGLMLELAQGIDFKLKPDKLGLYFLVGCNAQQTEKEMALAITLRLGVTF